MTTADKLRALAEAATPGPWTARIANPPLDYEPHVVRVDRDEQGRRRTTFISPGGYGANREADAAFIAALNPTVALAIADLLDAMEEEHGGMWCVKCAACDAEWPCPAARAREAIEKLIGGGA